MGQHGGFELPFQLAQAELVEVLNRFIAEGIEPGGELTAGITHRLLQVLQVVATELAAARCVEGSEAS